MVTHPEAIAARAAEIDGVHRAIEKHSIGPYLLTVTDQECPHVGDVSCSWHGDELLTPAPSSWPGSERERHLDVTLLWPPNEQGGYSLIIDGRARTSPDGLLITITRAVHYRPALTPGGEPCGADCLRILPS